MCLNQDGPIPVHLLTEVVTWMCSNSVHYTVTFSLFFENTQSKAKLDGTKSDTSVLHHVPCYTEVIMSHPLSTVRNKGCYLYIWR